METIKSSPRPKITSAVRSSVTAYLLAKTYASIEREKVDRIANSLLMSANYYTDPKFVKRGKPETITNNKDSWMLVNEDHIDFLLDLKKALQEAGYKIESSPGESEHSYKCPALVAEHTVTRAGWLVVDSVAEMIGEDESFRDRILCAGLDKYNQFIDLACKMVINAPGFKNPLTGESYRGVEVTE